MNIEGSICIPNSFLVVVDDVGWWCGNNDMYKNGPSRSGMNRRHCADDYIALIELGRRLNMRIKCGFVVGEWDRTNILSKVRNSNKYGSNWDNASRLDPSIDEVRDIINAGKDYMELALHGLVHMYWTDDAIMRKAEFYQRDENRGINKMTSPDIIREHLDAYFEILHENGLATDIKSFIPPCFIYTYSPYGDQLSAILAEYGIEYISTPFRSMQYTTEEKPIDVGVENGIITVDRTTDLTAWDAIGADPPIKIKKSYYGMHWVNFLSLNPKDNMDVVKRWVDYFSKYEGKFDILPARDNAMGSTQALYKRFTKIEMKKKSVTLDFRDINKQEVRELSPSFYMNAKRGIKPKENEFLNVSIYEKHDSYITYKLTRRNLSMQEVVLDLYPVPAGDNFSIK